MPVRHARLAAMIACALILSAATPALAQQDDFDTFFKRLDKNEDGKVAKDELPDGARRNFERIDVDGDGFASRDEMKAVFERVQRNRERNAPRNEGNDRERPASGSRVPDTIALTSNIRYAETDNARQTLDLLLPKTRADADKPLPVVVFIHGGGWRGGNKSSGISRLVPLVQTGDYAGVTVGYRLTNEAQWPEQIYDCKAAIRWVRANAKTYNLDPERIAVWGTSAGGHLVAMLGTSGGVEHLEGKLGPHTDVSSRVTCVVDWFGPADFATMGKSANFDHNAPNSPEALLLGGSIPNQLDKARDASPQTYVSKDDPPFLIMHGDQDGSVPVEQSINLDKALDAAGVNSTLITINGAGHGFAGPEINQAVQTFLAQQLRGETSEPLKDSEIKGQSRQRN